MRLLTGFIFLLLLISCRNKNKIPTDIIQMRPMQQLVWDMMQADELAFQRKTSDSTIDLRTTSFHLYDTVFAIHKVSREQFYKSYQYYQRHPAQYKTLMTGVRNIGEAAKKTPPSLAK